MRRLVCREFADPDQLVVEDVDALEPRPGSVVVDVAAAGVNYVDALLVQGRYQIKPPLPFTPGTEVAGTVSAVGDGVTHWAIGDRVLATTNAGGFSEQVLVRESGALAVPEGLSLEQAAGFLQSYGTMFYAYTRRTTVGPDDTVLVLGAGGGIGLAAVDLAKAMGARVIAAASSPQKLAAAEAAGADQTIDYQRDDLKVRARELAAVGGGAVTLVVDPVGGAHAEAALRAVGWGGRYLVIGFAGGPIPKIPLNLVLLNSRTLIGIEWGAWVARDPDGNRAMLGELLELAGSGALHPAEPAVRPLAEAGAVLTDLLERRVSGKVVLVP
ncbi:MAG TPA: NADPH:quinone oxidoreductase family protein [Acidimicrobiales bacterium]|nr:NADPH:quinone oxidoreductase family protein [Acidimicrobiales bacterium]